MKKDFRNSPLAKFFGYVAIGTITLGVLLFLGSHSLNFFQFTFTEDDAIYSWLGLLLTSGGVIGWLVVFEVLAKGAIQKGIALIMMVVGLLGEMATAVFDMRYAAAYDTFTFTDAELGQMTLLIGILGAVTGLCLIAFFAGDHIIKAFGDDDGDGIPNWRDTKDNRVYAQNSTSVHNAPNSPKSTPSDAPQRQDAISYNIQSFLAASGMKTEAAFDAFLTETESAGMAWKVLRDGQSEDGYKLPAGITKRNFEELARIVNPTSAGTRKQ
jgi:hypothetical protein